MTFTREWQSCWQTGSQLVEYGVEITLLEDSTVCADDNQLDPCCNPRLEWESDCCLERDIVTGSYLPISINSDNAENNCLNPECMETFAQDFREIYQSAIARQICVVNDEISTNISSIFEVCVTRYIGEQPSYGVSCFTDDDCDILGDSNAYCDLAAKKCVANVEDQQNSFLNCLIDRMGSFTKSLVYQELVEDGIADPSNSDNNVFLTADLLRDYAVDGEYRCLDDYGPMLHLHEFFTLKAAVTATASTCPVCNEENLKLHCLSTFGCSTPVQCDDVSQSCANNFVYVAPECEQQDSDDFVCNWDNTLSRSDCDIGDSKCMYCFNTSHCVELPASNRDECENTPVCVLTDGSVMWDVDKNTCEDIGSCSDGGSGDKKDCRSRGHCEDPDHILESIEALIPNFPELENATSGVCITPLEPENIPPCPLSRANNYETLDFTTQRGCVRIAECSVLALGGSCRHDPATEDECRDNFGGSWLSLPIQTQQACENPLGVDDDDFPGFCKTSIKDRYIEPRNKDDCLACGGTPVAPAYWKTPTWSGGQSVSAEWREAEMKETYHYITSTLSFPKLEALFERAAFDYEVFILNSGESCLVHPFLNYLDIVACDCGYDDKPKQGLKINNPFNGFYAGEECRDSLESDEIGTIWFCPDTDLQVGVISGIVGSLSEYVNGDLCFFSQIILASTSDFVGNRPSEPVTVTNDPNDLDPEPVRNKKGASVGVILGDGVGLIRSKNVQPVQWKADARAVQLTFSIDRTVFDGIPDWYILDFGIEVADDSDKTQPSDEIEVLPVGATDGSTVGRPISDFQSKEEIEQGTPIRIDGLFEKPFRYSNNARIYPIARLPDWEDEEEDEALSTGEQAMVGVFAGLYGIAFLLTVVFLVRALSGLNLSLLLLFFYLLATFSFRTAFWSIVAAGDYEETSSGYYILIEPPSFFIVSVMTILIMSYATMVAASKGSENLAKYWLYWLVLQLFLIAVLFVVVGLMIGLDTNDEIITDCFGRQSTVEENTIIRDIRIAYHSFLLFVAIVCCAIVIKIGRDLPEDDNKTTLQYLSGLSGGAVVATSLLWVIYSAVDSATPYFVIPLFFTEVPPLLLMTYLTLPSEAKQIENY